MPHAHRSFLPAAGHDWLLPLYDPLQWLLGGNALRRTLIDRAHLVGGCRVLDIGCGTGSLVIALRKIHPEVDVIGLDPDPKALARAGQKAKRAGVSVRLDPGFSDELPYPDDRFDHVFSSFMFHHLSEEEKPKTLREVRRVLAPGGSLHLADFAGPISELIREAGFTEPDSPDTRTTLFGRVASHHASLPSSATS